jgi:hypothetical protein
MGYTAKQFMEQSESADFGSRLPVNISGVEAGYRASGETRK